jgi:hypothetical protein
VHVGRRNIFLTVKLRLTEERPLVCFNSYSDSVCSSENSPPGLIRSARFRTSVAEQDVYKSISCKYYLPQLTLDLGS